MGADISVESVAGKLNRVGYEAFILALRQAKTAGNRNIELGHWLFQLLQKDRTDIALTADHYKLSRAKLLGDATTVVNGFRKNETEMPGISAQVADALCHQPVQAAPSETQLAALRRLLGQAQRPIVIAGGPGWTGAAADNLRRYVEANRLPLACAFRHQDLFDHRHPNYVGDVGIGVNPKLAARISQADLVIAVGDRLGEATTGGYALLRAPVPRQTLVHVHPDPQELGRVYQAALMINAGMPQFASRLAM